MNNYKERMLTELLDLTIEIEKLIEYMYKEDNYEKLLIDQYDSMSDYQHCLIERIKKEMGCKIDNCNTKD